MKTWHKVSFFIAATALFATMAAGPVLASSSAPGSKVSSVTVFRPNTEGNTWARVDLDLLRSGQPPCAGTTRNSFVFKVNSDAGKAWMSELITAKTSGLQVWIDGIGACAPPETSPGGLAVYEEVRAVQLGP